VLPASVSTADGGLMFCVTYSLRVTLPMEEAARWRTEAIAARKADDAEGLPVLRNLRT
jgi:hypothetical protein